MSYPLLVISPTFQENDRIPVRFTDDGENLSPPLIWANAPRGVCEYSIVCVDQDAPDGDFTHWVIYHIPGSMDHLDEGVRHFSELDNGAMQGKNNYGDTGFRGPSPPIGKIHRYVFTVYALDDRLDVPAGVSKDMLIKAMQGHVLAQGKITGLYGR